MAAPQQPREGLLSRCPAMWLVYLLCNCHPSGRCAPQSELQRPRWVVSGHWRLETFSLNVNLSIPPLLTQHYWPYL